MYQISEIEVESFPISNSQITTHVLLLLFLVGKWTESQTFFIGRNYRELQR